MAPRCQNEAPPANTVHIYSSTTTGVGTAPSSYSAPRCARNASNRPIYSPLARAHTRRPLSIYAHNESSLLRRCQLGPIP